MNKWRQKYQDLPWFLKNFYFAIILLFIVWMTFFDANNLFYQLKLSSKMNSLQNQKDYFSNEIKDVEALKEELFSTNENKEKFAREKYYMKKDSEDVFIIVKE